VALRTLTTSVASASAVHLHEAPVLIWNEDKFSEAADKEARKGFSTVPPHIELFGVIDQAKYHYRVKVDIHVPVMMYTSDGLRSPP